MPGKFPNDGSAHEVLEQVSAFLTQRGSATIEEIAEAYPDYAKTSIFSALQILARTGRAQVNKHESEKRWTWTGASK